VINVTRDAQHRYWIAGREVPGVTGILKSLGLIREGGDDYYLKRGEYVHEATALDDAGRLDESTLDPVILPYVIAWRKFRADAYFVPTKTELVVGSAIHQFGGTLDRIGTMGGRRWLLDLKTGAPEPWHQLQAALYAVAAEECGEPRGLLRGAVYLRSDGTYNLKPYPDEADRAYALAAVRFAAWKRKEGIAA
jgi:hypothetical protein